MSDSEGRVTNVQLKSELKVIRAEQKTEHFKTRMLVIVSAFLTGGLKVVSALGFVSVPHL